MKFQENVTVLANRRLQGDYWQIDMRTQQIAAAVAPGQFVHLQIPSMAHRLLRRPFSVYDVDPQSGRLSVIYKIVGEGTMQLSQTPAGVEANLLGPLGVGFSTPDTGSYPIIVAGGYGCAATYLLAKRSRVRCLCLLGGRSSGDLLLVDEFRQLAEVRLATNDGSTGHHGFVTDLLAAALDDAPAPPAVYACGPNPMLAAVTRLVQERGMDAEISLDHAMCCGVGACFACVVRKKQADAPDGWEYVRTCLEGPVFKASETVWD